MGLLGDVFKRNKALSSSFTGLEFTYEDSGDTKIGMLAMETCINFIARTISQSDFRITQNNKRIRNDWDYLLNVSPNTDQSASEFWHQFVYKLIYDNEVLVIKTDNDELLIADDFDRKEYAVFPDVFSDVVVKDYTFTRTFRMDEVIYLKHSEVKLIDAVRGISNEYDSLFSRMIEIQRMNNQIRGTVDIDATMQQSDPETMAKFQVFIDKLFTSFKEKLIALVPKVKGFNYTEIHDGSNNGKSVDELAKLKKDLTEDIANILGIPNSLVHGDMSDYETAIKAYIKFCIAPLIKKISDVLNARIIDKADYMKNMRVEVRGVAEMNSLEVATAIDKLKASGTYTSNQLRIKLGDEPVDNPALDEYVLTKNYEKATSSKGGEGEGDE
ncbi:phage portal protein [Paenibacillus glycanilyticus]|uniref:phage portal protein n=1 Tax=Paenibacillus glycanilyticus TaxID=126569 RepID=UPI0020404A75|nr:phage portal protein [Paenibacillus glycanilyticus]MCM3628796.1 phage portal protein [Paenibacillus glycanilyticus]